MMRIISYLNLSNQSNLEADSGFVFQKSLLGELCSRHEILLIGPLGMSGLHANVKQIEIPFATTKYGVRFGFAYDALRNALADEPPCDVLFNNQPELTSALIALCYEVWGRRIKCVNYCHYLPIIAYNDRKVVFDTSLNDASLGQVLLERQREAFNCADRILIGSNFGKQMLTEALGLQSHHEKLGVIAPPCTVLHPAGSQNTAGKLRPVILYNHRLYDHYGGTKLFEILEQLYELHDFELIVTDPTWGRSHQRMKMDNSVGAIRTYLKKLPFVKIVHCKTQNEYAELAGKIDFGLGPLREGALWSMAVIDVMSHGKPVIVYDSGAFKEVVNDSELLFRDADEFKRIFMLLLCNSEYRASLGQKAQIASQAFNPVVISKKFEDVFQNLLV